MKTSLRILNLEDNANDAELNSAMLSARWPECELVRVETREDFIAALGEGGFDIILSDYTMPAFDGRQALALSREKRPEFHSCSSPAPSARTRRSRRSKTARPITFSSTGSCG
jgi:CheY-like chemotaxis protein